MDDPSGNMDERDPVKNFLKKYRLWKKRYTIYIGLQKRYAETPGYLEVKNAGIRLYNEHALYAKHCP